MSMIVESLLSVLIGIVLFLSILQPVENIIKSISQINLVNPKADYNCELINENQNWQLLSCENRHKQRIIKIKQTFEGFSLIELVISCFLSLSIIAISINSLNLIQRNSKFIESKLSEISTIIRANAEIERVFRFSELHPLKISPIVHKAGQIKLSDGSLNKIHYGKLKPDYKSDALSNINLSIKQSMLVSSCSLNDGQISGTACLIYATLPEQTDYFLLYSLDGYQEAAGLLTGRGRCRQFNITVSDGIYFRKLENPEECNIISLIPVKAIQTLYFSDQNELRLITHKHADNIENQPLTLKNQNISLKIDLHSEKMNWLFKQGEKILAAKFLEKKFISETEFNFFLNLL